MDKIDTGDTAWLLASAALVMLMTPALGFFYGGLVRRKNVLALRSSLRMKSDSTGTTSRRCARDFHLRI